MLGTLLTTRPFLFLGEVRRLNQAAVGDLVNELLTTSGTNEPEPNAMRETEVLTRLMRDVAGGNPHVIRSLVARARALSAEGMLEELARDPHDPRVIEPSQLPEIDAQLDLAARARELSARADALLQAGNVRDAREPLQAVVELHSRLPSIRLRARALFERGRVSLAVAEHERAQADLADAAGIYRGLSALREAIEALEALSQARLATGGDEEAMRTHEEALDLARTGEDWAAASRVLLRLATLRMHRGAFQDALPLLTAPQPVAALVGQELPDERLLFFVARVADAAARLSWCGSDSPAPLDAIGAGLGGRDRRASTGGRADPIAARGCADFRLA